MCFSIPVFVMAKDVAGEVQVHVSIYHKKGFPGLLA